MTRAPIVALLVLACTIPAGCERRKEPATASGNNDATSPVTFEDAAGASYTTENTTNGFLRLKNGHYKDNDLVMADLDDMTAVGDLDGDGIADRVVLLVTSTGGSGIFQDLYVLRRTGGKLSVSEAALLGDRIEANNLRSENGEAVIDLVVQGADDPLCCPTQHVTYRFRLVDNRLEETTGQRRVYLKE